MSLLYNGYRYLNLTDTTLIDQLNAVTPGAAGTPFAGLVDSSLNAAPGGSLTNPFADDYSLVFGTTSPTSLVAQVFGQTAKNFGIGTTVGEPIALVNRSDVGADVFSFLMSAYFSLILLFILQGHRH